MKTLLKFTMIIGLLFSFASCKEEDKLKIDSELEITNATVLTINGEEVNQADFPNASISFEQLKSSSIIATLKNLVLGHPEVPIICTYSTVKNTSKPEKISFNGTSIYADIMNIDLNGVIDENNIISLNINTKYDYNIVGTWGPEQVIMKFSHPTIPTDDINMFASFINVIIKQKNIINDAKLILTEDGYIGQEKTVQYYIDDIEELFYIYVRYTITQELINMINDSENELADIFKMLNLCNITKNTGNITFPFKYKLDENSLTLYIDEEIMKPYTEQMKKPYPNSPAITPIDSVKKWIDELTFKYLKESNPELIDELRGVAIDFNEEIFKSLKAFVSKLFNMLIDPEVKYQIGIKFRRVS